MYFVPARNSHIERILDVGNSVERDSESSLIVAHVSTDDEVLFASKLADKLRGRDTSREWLKITSQYLVLGT